MQVANDLVTSGNRGRLAFGHGGTLARRVVVGAVAAAMVGAPAFLAPASASSSPSAVPALTSVDPAPESAKATFTVGILEDVDSLNPFTGINAEAYEAWGMMYDT